MEKQNNKDAKKILIVLIVIVSILGIITLIIFSPYLLRSLPSISPQSIDIIQTSPNDPYTRYKSARDEKDEKLNNMYRGQLNYIKNKYPDKNISIGEYSVDEQNNPCRMTYNDEPGPFEFCVGEENGRYRDNFYGMSRMAGGESQFKTNHILDGIAIHLNMSEDCKYVDKCDDWYSDEEIIKECAMEEDGYPPIIGFVENDGTNSPQQVLSTIAQILPNCTYIIEYKERPGIDVEYIATISNNQVVEYLLITDYMDRLHNRD